MYNAMNDEEILVLQHFRTIALNPFDKLLHELFVVWSVIVYFSFLIIFMDYIVIIEKIKLITY